MMYQCSLSVQEPELRRDLIEDYGWPQDFREDDWRRDRNQVSTRIAAPYDAVMAEQYRIHREEAIAAQHEYLQKFCVEQQEHTSP